MIEADEDVKVLVFKNADPDYFISHIDLTRIKDYRQEAAKLTGEASIALLFRHLRASRLVIIAQIEGCVRAAGSEFVLAATCALRHESQRFSVSQSRHSVRFPAGLASNTSRASWVVRERLRSRPAKERTFFAPGPRRFRIFESRGAATGLVSSIL